MTAVVERAWQPAGFIRRRTTRPPGHLCECEPRTLTARPTTAAPTGAPTAHTRAHHSPDPGRALAGVYEVLKPGGIVYIKDFFIKPCATAEERRRVLRVIERVDRLFAVKTAEAGEIIGHLRAAGFLQVWVEPPRFQVDNTRGQEFERRHRFDLFEGDDSFDWSQWLELKFQKP